MFEIVVIGGGPAGVTAALRARELGASVALVERDNPGGTCANDGCIPTRVLARSARLMRDSQQFSSYGLEGEAPTLDFARLLNRTQHLVYSIQEKKQILDHLRNSDVETFTGETSFKDPHTLILPDGEELQGEKFIICAGGSPRRIEFPGFEHAITHSDVWSLKKLPRSVAVVGAAATGCQLASVFAAFGARTTLLEVAPRILAGEDGAVSEEVAQAFVRRGIEIITGIGGVEGIERRGENTLGLFYRAENESRSLEVETVILAVGWTGNLEALNLQAARVESGRGYVVVDEGFRTTAEHVFAAGDITGRMMLVQSAGYEARTAAENAVLGGGSRHRHDIVPHGGFTDPEYASVGLTEERAGEGCVVATAPFSALDRAVVDGHPEGMCKLVVSTETHRIIGAHVVGEQALEIVHVAAAAMVSGMMVEDLAEMEIAYPTYTAVLGLTARRAVRELGVMPLVPRWRALGLPHAEWERSEA